MARATFPRRGERAGSAADPRGDYLLRVLAFHCCMQKRSPAFPSSTTAWYGQDCGTPVRGVCGTCRYFLRSARISLYHFSRVQRSLLVHNS